MPGSPLLWSVLTLAAALVTGAFLALAPLSTSETCEASNETGEVSCSSERQSLLDDDRGGAIAVLMVPAAIAVLPVLAPRRGTRLVTASALSILAFLAILSVGIFLVPTAVLAWIVVRLSSAPGINPPPGAE